MRITCEVNGVERSDEVAPLDRLLDVLRDHLHLTGTKEGCGSGECGACTVLLDDVPVAACLVPAVHANGHRIVTIEGVGAARSLNAVQEALIRHGAVQCGFCTPGIVLLASSAVAREPRADRERVRELLAGNLCRCTGYQFVVDAVAEALSPGSAP